MVISNQGLVVEAVLGSDDGGRLGDGGSGRTLHRQGKHQDAVKYHKMVILIPGREGEDSVKKEAFGKIADCYTEIGELEKATNMTNTLLYYKYIDQFINHTKNGIFVVESCNGLRRELPANVYLLAFLQFA
ncbi:protein fluorescent in blue light, chloroplastic isoform X2 [Tanacetum coccineum]